MSDEPFKLGPELTADIEALMGKVLAKFLDDRDAVMEALYAPLPDDGGAYDTRLEAMSVEELGDEQDRLMQELSDNGARLHNIVAEMVDARSER